MRGEVRVNFLWPRRNMPSRLWMTFGTVFLCRMEEQAMGHRTGDVGILAMLGSGGGGVARVLILGRIVEKTKYFYKITTA